MNYVPPASSGESGEFRLYDGKGNTIAFYDLPRLAASGTDNGYINAHPGNPNQKTNQGNVNTSTAATNWYPFGAFKSFTPAGDTAPSVVAFYSQTSGHLGELQAVIRHDAAANTAEGYFYSYSTVTNSQTSASASLVSAVTLKRASGVSGTVLGNGLSWTFGGAIRSVTYDYYTGVTGNSDSAYGRLGDLKLAQVHEGGTTGSVIDSKYYRYYKFTGVNYDAQISGVSQFVNPGPTNDPTTTGGSDTTFPAPTTPSGYKQIVASGLRTVVEGAAYDRMVTHFGVTTTADLGTISPEAIRAFADHDFQYERYELGDILKLDSNSQGTRYRAIGESATGQGCSACAGGVGLYQYSFTANSTPQSSIYSTRSATTWAMRTVEYLPDNTNAERLLVSGAMTSSGTTVTVAWNHHGFQTGDSITVSGADQSAYNGSFTITGVTTDSFTYTAASTPSAATATGTITVTNTTSGRDIGWADNDQVVTWTNGMGEVMLKLAVDHHGTTTESDDSYYAAWFAYNSDGQMIARASGDAIDMPSGNLAAKISAFETIPEDPPGEAPPPSTLLIFHGIYTVNEATGTSIIEGLEDSGAIETWEYTSSGFAEGDSEVYYNGSGDASAFLRTYGVQRGPTGTRHLLEFYTYYEKTVDGVTIWPLASASVYTSDSATSVDDASRIQTTYDYTYYQDGSSNDTLKVKSMTVTSASVTTGHHGSGSTTATETYLDTHGRTAWTKDATGHLTYTAYDDATGTVSKVIRDVNTSNTSDFSGLPSGWSNTSGLHLKTQYQSDDLGRVKQTIDPIGNVSWIVYKDAAHEVRTYQGWNATSGTVVSTVGLAREDRTHGYSEVLTMLPSSIGHTGSSGSYVPDGSESISNVLSLTRDIVNDAGQVIRTNEYFSLSGTTYSQGTAEFGTSSNDSSTGNYHSTSFRRGPLGNLEGTTTPGGTITRTEYNALGLPESVWVGTDETPTSGYWSPTNTAGTNLVKVADYAYDANGNLIRSNAYPGVVVNSGGTGQSAAPPRVSLYYYDWRSAS
ncbi:MAG: hypothetical protein QM770_14460 [Tepidisphaeraceae bacterium]